jgi:hypothetical protein
MTASVVTTYNRIVVTRVDAPGFVFTAKITPVVQTTEMPAITQEGGE